MSNHLAIATVTATLQRTLQIAIQDTLEGARITTVSPSEIGKGTPETGVNIFMYQVITNPALHNVDVAPMRTRGNPVKRQAALDLYYMLSCYGNNNDLAPQRLMGGVVQAMNDRRVITQEMIRDACQDATLSFLRESNLADQVQKISLLPLDLNLEDLSKTWSVFFQTPYVLSVAYKALVVMVDGRESLSRALPVRSRGASGLSPFAAQPYVEQVFNKAGTTEPILGDSTVVIKGKYLKGDRRTQVRIGSLDITPTAVKADRIELSLGGTPRQKLKAGVQTLQVIHPITEKFSGRQRRGPESNASPFVLRPRVLETTADQVIEIDHESCDATVTAQLDLAVDPKQSVVLSIWEWWPVEDERWSQLQEKEIEPPVAQLFDAEKRQETTSQVSFTVSNIKPGDYLLRVLVDGAESPLTVDHNEWLDPATKRKRNPQFNCYIGPKIAIR